MTVNPSGRIVVDVSGKKEHLSVDAGDPASIERALGYDLKPGRVFNAIAQLPAAQRELMIAQPQDRREQIMSLEGAARDAAIEALKAKPAEEKSKTVTSAGKPAEGSKV